jgi:hypothetical protein
MRATSTWRLMGGVAAGLLIAATFLGSTAAVMAAIPTGTAHNEALPGQYTAGSDVGFRATFDQQDTSTLSKLVLVLNVTGATANTYLSATINGASATGCTAGVQVTCTFKNVRPGAHVVVTAAFTPAAGGGPLTGDGIWSTSGVSTRNPDNQSHGDVWVDPNGAATSNLTDNPVDYGGGFSSLAGTSIGNGQTVTALNRQATKVTGLPAGVAATVLDGSGVNGGCGPYDCSSAIGQWSEVTVGDGQTFGTAFQIVITFYQGQPKSFVHQYSDGNGGFLYELVGACPKKVTAANVPCFTWNAKLSQATILTYHNGSWRGL